MRKVMLAVLISTLLGVRSHPLTPVFQLDLDGGIHTLSAAQPRVRPGTSATPVPGGTGFSFDGRICGLMLGDLPELRLTRSLSIACWVRLESYVDVGPGAQIVFRGDDRSGFDPYSLTVLGDGNVYFSVQNARDQGDHVLSPIPLHHWTHILGSLEDSTGEMTLWIDGVKVDHHTTKVRPFSRLDKNSAPGVSIGNIQFDKGPHNQPLHGLVADVRIYNRVVTPMDLHLVLDGWDRPIQ